MTENSRVRFRRELAEYQRTHHSADLWAAWDPSLSTPGLAALDVSLGFEASLVVAVTLNLPGDDYARCRDLGQLTRTLCECGVSRIIVETPTSLYVGRRQGRNGARGQNLEALKVLLAIGAIYGAVDPDVDLCVLTPADWKSRAASGKELSLALAGALWPTHTFGTHNAAEAALLGLAARACPGVQAGLALLGLRGPTHDGTYRVDYLHEAVAAVHAYAGRPEITEDLLKHQSRILRQRRAR